jgi:outer membrane receptor protein involved in Fe transport
MVRRPFVTKLFLAASSFVVFSLICIGQANAQVSGASLTGTVKDSSGGIIPNAQVAITDVATGVIRTVTTDAAGSYTAPNLLPGNYEVKVTASGFSTSLLKGITLTVGAQQLLDITMQVGQISQAVEVTTEAPTVELTSSTLGAEVTGPTVRELPLNGRSWTDLANLQPGVIAATSHGSGDQNRGFGGQISISGGRPQLNNYRLDGISINDYANGGPGSVLGGNLGVDAIQEFSVLTSNYSAEYGKTAGGVVNAITRSGTNQLHGSAYEFIRNSAVDARNFTDGAAPPPFKRNQFGASAGAPIRKDKTFIFGDYESIRQGLGETAASRVLSGPARQGVIHDSQGRLIDQHGCVFQGWTQATGCPSSGTLVTPLPAGSPCPTGSSLLAPGQAGLCVDDSVTTFLGLEPSPNGPVVANGDTAHFNFAPVQVVNENFFTIRLDQNISEKDKLFGTYSFDNAPSTTPDAFDNVVNGQLDRRQIAAVEETHTFGASFVNSVRLGYNRSHTQAAGGIRAINPAATDPALSWAPGFTNAARVLSFAGLSQIGPGLSDPAFQYFWNAYQIYDDAFVSKGQHSLKFGGTFENDQMNAETRTGDFIGTYSFPSIYAFLTNQPSRVRGVLPSLLTPRYMRTSIFGAYVQDDWRVRPNLTLNLGIRYEITTGITEAKGKLTNLVPITAESNGSPAPRLGAPYFSNPTLRNFEPRVGFSWDPFKTGKTAVRGGFGLFDVLPLLYTTITLNGRGAPFFQIVSTSNKGVLAGKFPAEGQAAILSAPGKTTLEYAYVEPQPKRDYVMQWNLNIQREVTRDLTVVLGYVGSHGVHQLFRIDDGNVVLPKLTPAGYLWPQVDVLGNAYSAQCNQTSLTGTDPAGCAPPSPVNPGAGAIRFVDWGGSSSYQALQLGVVKKISHGVQVQGSFTWGKSIDNNSGSIAGDTLANSITSLYWFDLSQTRGVSDYNIGRVLVINGSWLVPGSKSSNSLVSRLTNGWQIGGIFKVNDGLPITPTFGSGGDPLGELSSDPWDFPSRASGAGCDTATNSRNPNGYIKAQCFAVPTAPTPAFWAANCDPAPPSVGGPLPTGSLQCFNLRGNVGRNILRGPGLINLDTNLFKNNYFNKISETFNAQLRFEIFNTLNHANYQLPPITNDNLYTASGALDPNGGVITNTVTMPRELQLALKIIW